jgi:LacI family gluconate utilization system Gnt-I transcriptional repressor
MIVKKRSKRSSGKIRIEDVAEAANVSIMSVSRAVRGVEGISFKKREEILQIARNLGYYPNSVAVSLAASNSNMIGVSVPTLFGTVFSEIYSSMRTRFEKAGYVTMIDITDYNKKHEEEWVERMIAWRPAGLILTGVSHSEKTKERLLKSKIPVLEIWDIANEPVDICIGVDHFKAGETMGDYLVDFGYKKPAYVGIALGKDIPADRRLSGLNQSFNRINSSVNYIDRSAKNSSFESGYNATLNLMSGEGEKPDVICYLNDNMAFGGIKACENLEFNCPESIGIVGYNGLDINSVLQQKITTSITPRRKMGEQGADLLVGKIHGVVTPSIVELGVNIVPGNTTKSKTS